MPERDEEGHRLREGALSGGRGALLHDVLLRRAVSAENIADMALFLCSEAGSNISGQALSVCGNVESLK